jgi:hypothetical protein
MTTETSQIDKIYRNEKAPKVVVQTKDGNKYSCYDGSNISGNIREGQWVKIPFKQNGQWKNITGPVTETQEPAVAWDSHESGTTSGGWGDDVVEKIFDEVQENVDMYADIYKKLVNAGIPPELANTSASTIYIQLMRRRK